MGFVCVGLGVSVVCVEYKGRLGYADVCMDPSYKQTIKN